MEMNLFQRTVLEVYKRKECFGYKVIEAEDMFLILWNNPLISGLNVAHCNKLNDDEYNKIKAYAKDINISIASNLPAAEHIDEQYLQFDEMASIMEIYCQAKFIENEKYQMCKVETESDLQIWCNLASEIFEMQVYCEDLYNSLLSDLNLSDTNKYVAYINNTPVGIIETAESSLACLISWVGVKKEYRRCGICNALLSYAINREMEKGYNQFVLVSSEMGCKVYNNFGFNTTLVRYDYGLNKV